MLYKINKVYEIDLPELIKRNRIIYWNESQLALLIHSYNEGKSYEEISKIVGKSILACRSKICRLLT